MKRHGQFFGSRLFSVLAFCIPVLAMAGVGASETTASAPPAHQVVIQVSTGNAQVQRMALNNAINLQRRFGKQNVQIEIVAYGPGLSLLTAKSKYPERVQSMARQGIRFSACHNTMEAIKRRTGHMPDLLEGVTVVPSGIARIVLLQEQGYAYVRP